MPAAQHDLIRFTRDLVSDGYSHNELARLTRTGSLVHLRRGAYVSANGHPADASDRHRQLVLATVPLLAPGAVVSHESAAVMHGLPVWSNRLGRMHITRSRVTSGKRRGGIHLHTAPLPASDVVELAGVPVTSLARTVVDLSRTLIMDQAVCAGDAALRAGCRAEDLDVMLAQASGWPGVLQARRTAAFLDGRSESVGESLSRVVFWRLGLPAPQPQYEVFDDDGLLVGRSDFGWEAFRTLGEFDGKVKYGRLLKTGQTAGDVVYLEKRREDSMRDQTWEMVRWGWVDFDDEAALGARVRRALARGLARSR
jgi:hypothetical protein